MKNLKELEQKYLELGKEIEALKKQNIEKEEFTYPIYCKLKDSSLVVSISSRVAISLNSSGCSLTTCTNPAIINGLLSLVV